MKTKSFHPIAGCNQHRTILQSLSPSVVVRAQVVCVGARVCCNILLSILCGWLFGVSICASTSAHTFRSVIAFLPSTEEAHRRKIAVEFRALTPTEADLIYIQGYPGTCTLRK